MDLETWAEKINLSGSLAAEEIKRSLKSAKYFAGIISIKQLAVLHINSFSISFVLYYKKQWLVFYLSGKVLEIFDPTAEIWENPLPQFINFLCLHANKKLRINTALQSTKTIICGLYVIFFYSIKKPRMAMGRNFGAFQFQCNY